MPVDISLDWTTTSNKPTLSAKHLQVPDWQDQTGFADLVYYRYPGNPPAVDDLYNTATLSTVPPAPQASPVLFSARIPPGHEVHEDGIIRTVFGVAVDATQASPGGCRSAITAESVIIE